MKIWMLWALTILLLLAASVFLMWAIQTAWLGSFPGKDLSKYSMGVALQLGGAVICAATPIVLWVRHWRKNKAD